MGLLVCQSVSLLQLTHTSHKESGVNSVVCGTNILGQRHLVGLLVCQSVSLLQLTHTSHKESGVNSE